jgi:hypothetical protein
MSDSTPTVYFVIGTPGSSRRALVRDLAENGLAEEKVVVLLAEGELPSPADARLAKLAHVEVRRWAWTGSAFPEQELPAGATVFLLADPWTDIMDQLEALKPWLQAQGRELARILCCVDCQLAEKNAVLFQWYDAVIRFSDVVFLANREGVANKWLSDFIARYKDEAYPCEFIYMKKGDLPNPALVLDPTPRRLTQYFEEEYVDLGDIEIETDDEEEAPEDEEDDDGLPEVEPYFLRQRSGRREKELPDVRDFLPKK